MTKTGDCLLLQPCDEAAEDARGGAGVALTARLHAAEALFELVEPENGRRDGFGGGDGLADVLFGRTDESAEDLADVEAQQRHLPQRPDGLGGQRLATAGDADEQDALRDGQAEVAGLLCERAVPLLEPIFERFQAADVVELLLRLVILEQTGLADDGLLLRQDGVHVEVAVPHQALGEDVVGLFVGEAQGGFGEAVARVVAVAGAQIGKILAQPSMSARMSARVGREKSTTATSFSTSVGIFIEAESNITFLRRSDSLKARWQSRRRRTTTGSFRYG
jgi:hypothetical protein